ncbi:phosphotransferase family protein [Microbacterium sp. NPDC089698]|uniref:phosphotransferase family protein n=1 Tax=Microbacterium sp. NPDC089698 TaxID=3364200 RepID=UPI0038205117
MSAESRTVAVIGQVIASLGSVNDVMPLTGGMFASTYRVVLDSGATVVVKLTRADPSGLCQYERGIARTEAQTYRILAHHGLPVPELLHTDFSQKLVAADVVVTRHLDGEPWNERAMDDASVARANRGLGALMSELHRIHPPAFGYPAVEASMQRSTWRSAFRAMVDGILADADSVGVVIPAARVRAAMSRYADALDQVIRPSLVHADLWPANVFLDDQDRIVGLIDAERTIWGDPLLELVGADQFGLWDVTPELLAGNTAAGGSLERELATAGGAVRFALYRLYYALILVTEIDVRGYSEDWVPRHRASAHALLEAVLARLGV